jgi:hypothetical protein
MQPCAAISELFKSGTAPTEFSGVAERAREKFPALQISRDGGPPTLQFTTYALLVHRFVILGK